VFIKAVEIIENQTLSFTWRLTLDSVLALCILSHSV